MYKIFGSVLFVLVFSSHLLKSQNVIRELPSNVNHPSVNLYAPFISGDGQTMVYLSDYTDDGHHVMYFARKKGVSTWYDGVEINKVINRPTHNFRGGYSLSFDGKMLLYTSRKSGLGGYEIWYSERNGDGWGQPKNMGGPVNSASNEGSAMISPDGQYLYFMRCESMSEYRGAKGCRLMVSKRKNNKWTEPEELPAKINTGNSQTPRMLADGETLLFSSDQMNGKGGLDIYMTKKLEEGWTNPQPLDFINDEKNNTFVSVPAKGRYMYADIKGARSRSLAQVLIPEELRPKGVMRIQGKVSDVDGVPVNANLTVFDINNRKRLWNDRVGNKGEFTIVLNEGASYDLAVTNGAEDMYYSKVYELDTLGPRDKERLKITVKPIAVGESYGAPIKFQPYSSSLSDNATFELRRIANMMRKNQNMQIELSVALRQYRQDTIPSDDLTEVLVDSIIVEKEVLMAVDTSLDSSSMLPGDILADSTVIDSTAVDYVEDSVRYEVIEEVQLKYTYHNDRTEAQALAIKEYLQKRGVSEGRISITTLKEEDIESDSQGKPLITQPEVSFKIIEL